MNSFWDQLFNNCLESISSSPKSLCFPLWKWRKQAAYCPGFTQPSLLLTKWPRFLKTRDRGLILIWIPSCPLLLSPWAGLDLAVVLGCRPWWEDYLMVPGSFPPNFAPWNHDFPFPFLFSCVFYITHIVTWAPLSTLFLSHPSTLTVLAHIYALFPSILKRSLWILFLLLRYKLPFFHQ